MIDEYIKNAIWKMMFFSKSVFAIKIKFFFSFNNICKTSICFFFRCKFKSVFNCVNDVLSKQKFENNVYFFCHFDFVLNLRIFVLKRLTWKMTSTTTTTWIFMMKFNCLINSFKNIISNDEQFDIYIFLFIVSSIQDSFLTYFWFLKKNFSMTTTAKEIRENKCTIKIYMIKFIYISPRQFIVLCLMRCAKWKNFCKSKFHVVWI